MKLDEALVATLPNDREFSLAEAMISYTDNRKNGRHLSIKAYAARWRWGFRKTKEFIEGIESDKGYKVKRRGRKGPLNDTKTTTRIHLINQEDTRKATPKRQQGDNLLRDVDMYISIFDHWNAQGLKKHRGWEKLKSGQRTFRNIVDGLLEDWTLEEIKQTITNYATIVKSKDHFYTHRFLLPDFLVRSFEKFTDWDIADQNFREKASFNGKPQQPEPVRHATEIWRD